MPLVRLERLDDPRIAEYRDVPDPVLIRARGLFVAEGRLVVRRLVEGGRHAVRSLLLSEASYLALAPTLRPLVPDVPIYLCALEQFRALTGLHFHRGCLALVERPAETDLLDLVQRALLLVVLEGVTNADNVGGVFRSAAAFGADGVLLSPSCCDPLYRKAIRTSMAATLAVPFCRPADWPGGLATLRRHGFCLVALTPRAPSETLDSFASRPRPDRLALLVGAEGGGLSDAAMAAAHYRVTIPIRRNVDSLNLSVAAGIALSRLTRIDRL